MAVSPEVSFEVSLHQLKLSELRKVREGAERKTGKFINQLINGSYRLLNYNRIEYNRIE